MVHQYDIYKALAAETHNEELKKAKAELIECKKTIQEQAIENEGLVLQLDDMKKKEEGNDDDGECPIHMSAGIVYANAIR